MPFQMISINRILIMVIWLLPGFAWAGSWYASVGAGSDYVWRGMTQTGGSAAVSGGVEFVDVNNVYAGVWVSNTNLGTDGSYAAEVDIYMGVSGKSEETGYDMGYIAYQYPGNNPLNFEEFYAALSVGGFTVKASDSSSAGNYVEAGLKFKFPTKRKISMSLHFGRYNRDDFEDYHDTSISLHINELTFTASETDLSTSEDESLKVFINWEHNVDF